MNVLMFFLILMGLGTINGIIGHIIQQKYNMLASMSYIILGNALSLLVLMLLL